MRAADRALPDVVLDDAIAIAHWPVRPVFAIEGPPPQAHWDDGISHWDDPLVMWDGDPNATGWLDATCSWTGAEIDTGVPDESMLVPATRLVLQLDNRDGRWSGLTAEGTQSVFGPGKMLQVYAHNDEGDWWVFAGRISRWDQRADDSVEVEAFDSFSDLAQPFGTYTPGVAGQLPHLRLQAIIDLIAADETIPHRFDHGTVALTAQETDQSPLEEMQTVAQSDAGMLLCDADGTLLFLDRTWRQGRTDQPAIPSVSGNVCTADVVIWDPLISTSDSRLADYVVLENVAELRADDGVLPGYVFAQSDQQWTLQEEGDALAALYLDELTGRTMRLEEFTLYLNDPQQSDVWRAVDWRRLDRLHFVQDRLTTSGAPVRVEVDVLLSSLLHEITPDGWSVTIGTSRAIAFTAPTLYDTGHLYDNGEEYGF